MRTPPREVIEIVFRAAKRLGIETVLVANQRLQTPPGNPRVTAVWVDGGPDVADQYIAAQARAGDLVVPSRPSRRRSTGRSRDLHGDDGRAPPRS